MNVGGGLIPLLCKEGNLKFIRIYGLLKLKAWD